MSKMKRNLHITLWNQLFPIEFIPKDSQVLMSEAYGWMHSCRHHKQKLVMVLSAARHYADTLKENGYEVSCVRYSPDPAADRFFKVISEIIRENAIEKITIFEVEDHSAEEQILSFLGSLDVEVEVLASPMFFVGRSVFRQYLDQHKNPMMKSFYETVRKRTGIMMEDGKPVGGKFSFDTENRKRMPSDHQPSPRLQFDPDYTDGALMSEVGRNFSNYPGSLLHYNWATTRSQAMESLDSFLRNHFSEFGDYQDAIVANEPKLHHSLLSPYLNLGLITPKEVVERALEFGETHGIPLNSIEGFVRQIIGWREFVRGIYHNFDKEMSERNYWNHQRSLSDAWYEGTTGIPPLDAAIRNTVKHGYTHHIERLMVIANLMNLCEIHPKEVHRWFMEMFVDSAEWVMAANVYGMGLMSEGGIFATKPYISGSNYIRKMSNYPKGKWCDIWDGLFWRFIDRNREFLESNQRMSMMVKTLDRMDPERFRMIKSDADAFLEKATLNGENHRRLA